MGVSSYKLTKFLYKNGYRYFVWNFHNTTLLPKMTSYTGTPKEVTKFIDSFRYYFDFFLKEMGGEITTPSQAYKILSNK